MRSFFPNIETAVIFVFLICIMLWGVSRCRKKKDEAALKTATEAVVTPLDTLTSPAASRATAPAPRLPSTTPSPIQSATPPPTTLNTAPSAPSYSTTPLPSSPTVAPPPSSPSLAQPTTPQSYNTPVRPQQQATTPPMPSDVGSKSPKTTTSTASEEPSGAPLYVLINGLNVRAKPELKAKSMGKLKINDVVYFQNEKTEVPQTVRLADGTSVTKPWFKIKTRRGTVGWVHGSGVDFYKRKPNEGL
jgi:hypothetical protein